MASPAILNLHNFTILSQCMAIISPYLQDPTLMYHDGSGDMDVIAKSLSESQTFMIAKVPEHPTNNQLYSTRSAILLAKSPEPMASILHIWPQWKARSRVVVFVNDSSEVHNWIETLWKRTRAADILAVVLSEPPQYFTWFPYKPGECSNVTTIVAVNSSNLFPKKVTLPLYNCSLIAVTTPLPPFVMDHMDGSEMRMFRDSAEKLGMKPTYFELPTGQTVWTIFDSKYQPYTGLKLLFENQVDILFSELSMSVLTAPFAEFTIPPHIAEKYILFVPGPVEAPRTTAIIKAFTPRAWTFVIIASFFIYATMVVIPLLDDGHLQPAFIPAIALILNTSTNFPSSRAILTFAVIAYIYSMHITTAYTSSLIVFLSDVPREKPLESVEDVVDSGLKVQAHYAFKSAIDSLSLFSAPIDAINQPNRILTMLALNLSEVAERKNCVIGPKIAYEYRLRQDEFYDEFDYPRVNMLKEPVYTTFITFYISKGHPLYNELNDYFTRLIEGGFPGHYVHLVQTPRRPKLRNLEPFSIQNVEGPFILLLSLLGACTFAWMSEWIFFWLKNLCKRKNPGEMSRTGRRIPRVLTIQLELDQSKRQKREFNSGEQMP